MPLLRQRPGAPLDVITERFGTFAVGASDFPRTLFHKFYKDTPVKRAMVGLQMSWREWNGTQVAGLYAYWV